MKGRLNIIAFIVVSLTLLAGIFTLLAPRIEFLKLERIEVIGNKKVPQKEILSRSGLMRGSSAVFFKKSSATREILKNPWITTVRIKREFPRKVTIEVEEAEPFCLLLSGEGEAYYMTENGQRLGKANFYDGLDFPLLVGEGIVNQELLGDALQVLKLSVQSPVLNWSEISEVNLDSIYGITVFTTDKRRIDFGMSDLKAKWHKVEKIITHSRKISLTERYINVSSQGIGVVDFRL